MNPYYPIETHNTHDPHSPHSEAEELRNLATYPVTNRYSIADTTLFTFCFSVFTFFANFVYNFLTTQNLNTYAT